MSTAPLGRPVVPDVYMMAAGAAGSHAATVSRERGGGSRCIVHDVGPSVGGAGRCLVAHHDDRHGTSSGANRLLGNGRPLGIGEQEGGPAVAQEMGHLGGHQAEVKGHRNGSEAHDASERFDVLGPVGHEDSDAPAHGDAEPGERRGDSVEAGIELLIADPVAIRPQGDVERLHVCMPADEAGPRDGIRRQHLQLVMVLEVIHVHDACSPYAGDHARSLLACAYRPVTNASSRASVNSISRRVFFE